MPGPDDTGKQPGGGGEHPVTSRRTRSVLILPARELPPATAPADLREVRDRLRADGVTGVRAIGGEQAPEAIAATLTEAQIDALHTTFPGLLRAVEDTPLDQ